MMEDSGDSDDSISYHTAPSDFDGTADLDGMLSTDEPTLTIRDMNVIKKIIIPRISTYWEILQAYLMLDITSDDESAKKYNGDSKQCCTALLEDWIISSEGFGDPKTYAKLLDILNEIPEVTGYTKIIKECLEKEGVFIGPTSFLEQAQSYEYNITNKLQQKEEGSSIPLLKDLFEDALSHATNWKEIGVLLGLPSTELEIIEKDNTYKVRPCCLDLVQKWLEIDPDASWAKWHKAVGRISGENIKAVNTTESSTPSLEDLIEVSLPHATYWKEIGAELGLSSKYLNIIENENVYKVVPCCLAMLQKWLEMDPDVSWPEWYKALAKVENTGMKLLSDHVRGICKRTRFPVDVNSWPPEQPKEFTPVVLIHYEDQYDTATTPHIVYPSREEFCEMFAAEIFCCNHVPGNSTTTKDITKILSLLEKDEGPQVVLIEGAPGIGKSVLLREIAYRWANLEVLHKFKLLLLVSLRDPLIQKMTSFKELCLYFCKQGMEDTSIISTCTQYFFKNGGKNLVFLLDGYDEFPDDLRQKNGNLIADILCHKELPDCGIIVSSRPHASIYLRQLANLRVEILGFTEIEQVEFIRQGFKGQPQRISKLTQYLKQNLIISSMCIVPFNMMTLLYLYKVKCVLPDNSTDLYNLFICTAVHQNLLKHKVTLSQNILDMNKFPDPYGKFLNQLSEWSLLALHKNKLTFTLDEIKTVCPEIENIPGAISGFGLLRTVEHFNILGTTKTFNFVHFSIQEFLAANYISEYLPHGEMLTLFEEKFWDNFYSNMFTLYVALTKGQQPAFQDFLCDKTQKRPSFTTDFFHNKKQSIIAEKFLTDQLKCLHLFRCFSEANDDKMCMAVESAFASKKILLGGKVLLPNEVQSVAVLLTQSSIKHWDKLDLFLSHIQHHGIRILHHALKDHDITIREIIFTKNGLCSSSDSLVKDIVINCKVEVLWISYNDCVGETKHFSTILSDPACKLKTLYLRFNKLSSNAAISLFTELRKASNSQLELLEISNNHVDDYACGVIAVTLKSNRSLKRLEMYNNPITIKGVEKLLQTLQTNTTLRFLGLPKYSDHVTNRIKFLETTINNERKQYNCYEELKIYFSA